MNGDNNDLKDLLKNIKKPEVLSYKPVVFDISKSVDLETFRDLLVEKESNLLFCNELELQLKELFKIRNPKSKLKGSEQEELYQNWLKNHDFDYHGLYIFYPWSNKIVHTVTREEFIELRTSRNKYKITKKEQELLANKTLGVIGLSVGQSVAVTMAIERVFGKIKIADFDHLELTNLNRIRAGIDSLGVPKTIMVAREIAEIDPFLEVEIYNEGINEGNIESFLGFGEDKIDALIEECDSLDIKILSRLKAREKKIPVIMDTSDRGMIDIERFDLEPEREILHGRVKVDNIESLKVLSYEEKIPFILEMVGADQMSSRLKSSMLEVEQTLSSWPQLAGDVAMGGAICTELVRELLLGRELKSGRFYIDPLELINGKARGEEGDSRKRRELDADFEITKANVNSNDPISPELENKLLDVAILAPSAGNVQPWKFSVRDSVLYIFLDPYRIEFFGDFNRFASLLSVGGVIENIASRISKYGYTIQEHIYPNGKNSYLAAALSFKKQTIKVNELETFIEARHTNRNLEPKSELPVGFMSDVTVLNESFREQEFEINIFDGLDQLEKIGRFIASADVQRLLYKYGHKGFYNEIRWGDEEAKTTGDGIDIETVEVTEAELAGFSIARDWKAVELLSEMNLGSAFGRLSNKQILSSSAVVHISAKDYSPEAFVNGGRLMEKVWLLAEKYGIGFHPLLSTCLFNNQFRNGGAHYMPKNMHAAMSNMQREYLELFDFMKDSKTEVFMARLFVPQKKVKKAYRRDKQNFMIN